MIKKSKKGFTIIELIVVIAIIAILAAIVLANVTTYINKAKDARIQSDMGSIAAGVGSCYGINASNGGATYSGCSTDPTYIPTTLTSDISTQNGGTAIEIGESSTQYCDAAKLNSGKWVCVDYTGVTKIEAADPVCKSTAPIVTACP